MSDPRRLRDEELETIRYRMAHGNGLEIIGRMLLDHIEAQDEETKALDKMLRNAKAALMRPCINCKYIQKEVKANDE